MKGSRLIRYAFPFAVPLSMFLLAACDGGNGGGPAPTPTPGPLSLLRLTGAGIEQADSVRGSSADVDICETLDCGAGVEEPFGATRVKAVFVNSESQALNLTSYTVSIRESGQAPVTRALNVAIPGGRCTADGAPCAGNVDCVQPADTCVHPETEVELVLYDVPLKVKLRNGRCDELVVKGDGTVQLVPSTVSPRAFNVDLTFSGANAAKKRVTIGARYLSTFGDFRNCPEGSGAGGEVGFRVAIPTPTPTATPVPEDEG